MLRSTLVAVALALTLAAASGAAAAPAGAPGEFKLGFVDFFSGPASVFGIPQKNAAEWLVESWNKTGGIRGVKIQLVTVDESGGPAKQVTEFRRLVLDEKVDAVVGYTSSADCLAVAPVAEELKVLTVIHVCGSRRLIEERQLKYVFRTSNSQIADSVMGARYVLAMKPDVTTIAGANEDFAYGRDSWEDFKGAMLRLKPDVKVAAELWTKIQASEYSAEISKLLTVKPDVIHTTFWSAGLIAFVKQAAPRALFKQSLVFISAAEHAFQDLKKELPDGVIASPRATGAYFLRHERNPQYREFMHGIRARYGRYPDQPYHNTYQALAGLKAAYEKAIDLGGGRWPKTEDVIRAFEGLTWQVPFGTLTMRADHQAVHPGIIGVTRFSPELGFPILDRLREFRPEEIMPPLGTKALDWLKTLE
jgi:branched-chain amino acid transport system substrate-binding protein